MRWREVLCRASSRTRVFGAMTLSSILLGIMPGVASGEPYEDTRHRFRMDLPSGWALAPDFGDTNGMTFERTLSRRRTGAVAKLRVHVTGHEAPSMRAWIAAYESSLPRTAERVRAGRAPVGGREADTLEMRFEERGEVRALSAWFLSSVDYRYRIEVEVPADHRGRIARDVGRVLASFEPLGPRAKAAPAREPVIPAVLVGRYKSEAGLVLELLGDGRFSLGEVFGVYSVEGRILELRVPGKDPQSFTYRVRKGRLTLASPQLPRPLRYTRIVERDDSADSQPGPDRANFVGRWRADAPNGAVELVLASDGTLRFGGQDGRWTVDTDGLRLAKGENDIITYRVRFLRSRLVLSGADLDAAAFFDRVAP